VTQHRSLRILLQPANYYLREAITIEALETTEITIETIFPVNQPVTSFSQRQDDAKRRTPSPKKRALKRATSFRNMLNCRSVPDIDAIDTMESEEEALLEFSSPVCASLQLRTRRHNEPIFWVRYGTIKLVNVQLVHNSHGIDIWNGNAAIQIQPAIGPDDEMMIPMSVPRPFVYMEKVDITSISGRGIVNIDGGFVSMKQCYVHDCAATGIYIGGPGTDAVIESSDVVRNGNGNKMRRGIARGHSGIYLEQGNALVRDCNISRNSLTGISAVSLENAILNVHDSDLVANGTTQLELPPQGSTARRLSSSVGNFIFPAGISRPRSGLADEDPEAQVSTD
jgi:Right handed beta helix region